MHIKRLILNNFRQYKGEQTIEFSDNLTKNVTLILGRNTSGKSTLVQAFRWVLYDDLSFSGKKGDKNAILNSDVAKAMMPGDENVASVTLTIVRGDAEYDVNRTYIYHSKIAGSAHYSNYRFTLYQYDSNGERRILNDRDNKLKEIMPESLSEYFFFDGEKISQSRISSNVKDSINTIMGLVPLEHMKNHLKDGRYNVMKSLRDSLHPSNGVSSINARIDRVTKDRDGAEANKKEAQKHLDDAIENETKASADMLRVKDISEYAAELKEVDSQLDQTKKDLTDTEKTIIESFSDAMMETMLNIVSLDIRENLAINNYDDKGIPGMDATAVHHILDSGKCICGSDLKNNEQCRRQLLDLLTYLPPESIGSQITHLNVVLKGISSNTDKQDLFRFHSDSYCKELGNYDKLDQRHDFLTGKVKGVTNADEIAKGYELARKMRNHFQSEVVRFDTLYREKVKELDKLNSELSAASREDEYNAEIINKMEYVQALYDKAVAEYDKNSGDIFSEVKDTLTETFKSMYHGQRNIELTPDYKVKLNVGGESLDNSKGLDTVQNFAFIASLVKVARNRANGELNSESFPLVMDAVFSNTDEIHIRNICEVLPKLSGQSILAIMEKDWDVASKSLDRYVGKRYVIDKKTETYSQIREIKV
jgi:DNA sulfur modification protein DndD